MVPVPGEVALVAGHTWRVPGTSRWRGSFAYALKTLRSWIERGILHLKFDPDRYVQDLFSDEPLYRMLDEYPELINIPKVCSPAMPEWFHRYENLPG